MSGGVLLSTARLTLRRFTRDDAQHIFELDSDPEVMRYLNGGAPTPMRVVEAEILAWFCEYDDAAPGVGVWAIERRDGGDFVGWVGLMQTARAREAGLGFRLRRAAWGLGYATESARALMAVGFERGGLERVVATTYEENLGSRRVLEKLGLREVRRFRYTPEEIAAIGTCHTPTVEVWPGEDIEFALDRVAWQGRPGHPG